jgi:hypothetical protein
MTELLFIALVVACPLMMMLMMRGGHGHGGHAPKARSDEPSEMSTASLRRLRADVDSLIAERTQAEGRPDETTLLGGEKQ